MRNKEKIEMLKERIKELRDDVVSLRGELTENRMLRRWMRSKNDTTYKAINLQELQTMQERILDLIGVELKTTPAETKLVKKSK